MAEKAITWYNRLKEAINGQIKQNGKREITGAKLNSVLNQMVDALGKNMTFGGVVSPATVIDNTDDNPVFYLALEAGNYPYCGNIVVGQGQIAFLFRDANNIWHQASWNAPDENFTTEEKEKLQGLPTEEQLREAFGAKANAPESKPGRDNLASFDEDGNLKDSGVSIPVPTEEEKEHVLSSGETGLEWVPKPVDGADAYGVYVKEYKEGHEGSTDGMLTRPQWLLSLKGEKGDAGNNGHNPNLGTYKLVSGNITPTPPTPTEDGDYIVVIDDSDPTNVTSEIYKYNGSAWQPTGRDANQAYFGSGEPLINTYIDDTELENPREGSLAKAPEVAAKLRNLRYISGGIDGEEIRVNYTRSEQRQLVTGVNQTIDGTPYNAGDYIPQTNTYYTTEIDVSGWDYIKFRGLYQKTNGTLKTGFAFGHYSDGNWVCDHAEKWSESPETSGYIQGDYEIKIQDIAPGATHFRTAVAIYGMPESAFYILLRKGDTVIDVTKNLVEEAVREIEGEISEVEAKIVKLEDNTQGFDFIKVSQEYAPINRQAVMGVDGYYLEEAYSAGDIITGLDSGAYSTEVEINPDQFDRVRFRGMIIKAGSTADMTRLGYAFGYYSSGVWQTVKSGHWRTSSETTSYTGKEYIEGVPQNQGVTHFRVTCGYYANVPVNKFYIYFEKGKTIKQYIDDEFYERQTHPRPELVGKRYCNMSSSTFSSFQWHMNLVESIGMEYLNVGMGGAAHRCSASTRFSLDYQNPDTSQAPVANRVILNQIANILTHYFNDAYYPHFIVSCCVLNDCSPSSVSLNQIGTAAEASNVDFANTQIISALFNCASASDVATNFDAFFVGNAGNYSSMVCFRLALELLSHYFPKTQILVSSCQKIGNSSFNYAAIDQFNAEQEKMCGVLSIPYIRLNSEVGINDSNLTTWLSGDKLHPNSNGQMLYTNYFRQQLMQRLVVRDNIP